MGSFNETCALSNLNIPYGTKVRLLLLTQNPYVLSGQHEQHRGCYHYDQWFVRTPPIKGKYDDYGRCAFKEDGPIPVLVAKLLDKDAVERSFGFNQYHSPPVVKGRGLRHYLEAAWEGRLLVQDHYTRPRRSETPKHWPTWEGIHAKLIEAKFKLQIDGQQDGGGAGYNAQPVAPGVVCVTFNAYEGETTKLKKVVEVLAEFYDCQLVYNIPDRKYEPSLMVVPKGAFDNPALIFNAEAAKAVMTTSPKSYRPTYQQLPTMAVMVREDVWNAYCTTPIEYPSCVKEGEFTVEKSLVKLKKYTAELMKRPDDIKQVFRDLDDNGMRDVLSLLPFKTMAGQHVKEAAENEEFPMDELLLGVAELAQIEYVMASLHHSWYIPPLGGQESNWKLRTALMTKITAICKRQLKREEQELDSDEDE